MTTANEFTQSFLGLGLNYFTGIPDSTLKEWLKILFNDSYKITNRIAANEGAAISNAAGYHLATGNIGVVYLQNSGLGNCVNPLTSLTDPDVYGIPMIILIGWRGVPGCKDEPQHKKMGAITEEMLVTLDVPYFILESKIYQKQIHDAKFLSHKNKKPFALIVKPGFFELFKSNKTSTNIIGMVRENAIRNIVDSVGATDLILSTTGKASRELYEVSANQNRGHNNNFYNVGSMGHVGAIGLEVAIQKNDKLIYILDGDGALIMHMGTLAAIGYYCPGNLIHIVFDNESHESTGGQSTLSKNIDIAGIMKNCNYRRVESVTDESALMKILYGPVSGPLGIVIKVKQESRSDLGRPSDTPKDTKVRFMDWNN